MGVGGGAEIVPIEGVSISYVQDDGLCISGLLIMYCMRLLVMDIAVCFVKINFNLLKPKTYFIYRQL